MRSTVILLFLSLTLLPAASAQSDDSVAGAANSSKAQPKSHRVWDNESVQQIQGGISVVGNSPSKPPAATTPARPNPQVNRAPGVFFKAMTIDGEQITSDSLYGKTVLVQYWATWCPHCQADQAPVDRIARSFSNQDVVVLAVDVDESASTVKKYLTLSPRQVPIILEKDTNLGSLTTVKGFPTYIVIDRAGRIAGTARGETGEQGLRKLLSRAGIKAN